MVTNGPPILADTVVCPARSASRIDRTVRCAAKTQVAVWPGPAIGHTSRKWQSLAAVTPVRKPRFHRFSA